MKRILQLDGGGCKGIMQLLWLVHIEKEIGKPIHDIFDLIVGTSIGAIVGAIAANGRISMNSALYKMEYLFPKIFKRRFRIPFRQPKYDRKIPDKFLREIIGESTMMKQLHTNLMVTSVNMVDGRNHFFKSWESKDGGLGVVDVINRSYAAPLYFGGIVDYQHQAVWLDGGTGNMNCPLDYAIIQALRNGWIHKDKRVCILSLGAGYHNSSMPFKKAARSKNLKQMAFFIDPKDGGLAREQASASKVAMGDVMNEKIKHLQIDRVDVEIPKKIDRLDGAKYINKYLEYAETVKNNIPINKLK